MASVAVRPELGGGDDGAEPSTQATQVPPATKPADRMIRLTVGAAVAEGRGITLPARATSAIALTPSLLLTVSIAITLTDGPSNSPNT